MNRNWLVFAALLAALGILAALWGVIDASAGASALSAAQQTPAAPEAPHRQIDGDASAPDISFIDSPSATCYVARPGSGNCYVSWSYLSVTATSAQYIISMTVSIDNRIRAFHAGFFQSSMYIPGDMYGPGFRVACGIAGDNPSPNLGKTYSYIIRARETGGLGASNFGSVTCPADKAVIYLPFVQR